MFFDRLTRDRRAMETRDQRAAERGAALLDRARPDWFLAIDLPRLNLRYCSDCPLGQLGSYDETWEWLKLFLPWAEIPGDGAVDPVEYGFDLPFDCASGSSREKRWARHTDHWRTLINARLKAHYEEGNDVPVASTYVQTSCEPWGGLVGSVRAGELRGTLPGPRPEVFELAVGR